MRKAKELPALTELSRLLRYDAATGKLLWKVGRGGRHAGTEAGTILVILHDKRDEPLRYRHVSVNKSLYLAHRLIWVMCGREIPEGMCIDHIDGDGLNNRLENLRCVTPAVNQRNRSKTRGAANSRAGVYRDGRRWRAEMKLFGNKLNLGSFSTFAEASAARQRAEDANGFVRREAAPAEAEAVS